MANLASKTLTPPAIKSVFPPIFSNFKKGAKKVFRKYFAKLSLPRISKQVVEQEEEEGFSFEAKSRSLKKVSSFHSSLISSMVS